MSTYVSISGGGSANVHIYGNGTVVAGNGNDSIHITGNGAITVGSGNDQMTLHGSEHILERGASGNDTINLGHGHDTITEAGRATVHGFFGSVSIQGGTAEFSYRPGSGGHGAGLAPHHAFYQADIVSGNATLMGGAHCTEFVGGTGNVVMQGGTGNDTFVGGSGHTSMTGGSGHNLFAFTSHGVGGTDVITNFVSGQDKLYLEGKSLCYLQSHGDVTTSHGNTFITLDGGKTTVELKGFTGLSSHDITTHK